MVGLLIIIIYVCMYFYKRHNSAFYTGIACVHKYFTYSADASYVSGISKSVYE